VALSQACEAVYAPSRGRIHISFRDRDPRDNGGWFRSTGDPEEDIRRFLAGQLALDDTP
jgi:hypothetical protein